MTTLTPKRILLAITKATFGGAQRYVYDLAVASHAEGHEVVVAYGTKGLLVDKLLEAGVRTIEIPGVERDVSMFGHGDEALKAKSVGASFLREYRALRAFIKLLKTEKPDVLHLNSSKIGVLGALAGRIAGVKRIIFTAHGWAFNERRPLWQRLIFYVFYAATLLLSHITICVSNAVKRDVRFIPFGKHVVIHHGIDAPLFMSQEEARTRLFPGKIQGKWIGMLSELHPTKRVEDAVDALYELRDEYPDLHLMVLGEGELKEWLMERILHYNLQNRVHLLGFVPEAPRYLKAFDYFLFPSRSEALGYAAIEAGYAGLPVVASRVGGIPEIIKHKDTGLLIPPENPHALARALRALIDDPQTADEYGKKLEKYTREEFSKAHMIEKTLELYEHA